MIRLTKFKRWAVLAGGLITAVFSLALLLFSSPAVAAPTSTTGDITGGPYTFKVNDKDVKISSDTTTVTLDPKSDGSSVSIDGNGKLTVTNVTPGDYTVTITFSVTQKNCNTLAQILDPATYAILCGTSGQAPAPGSGLNYKAQKVFTTTVTAGNTVDLGGAGSLGTAVQVSADGTPIIKCKGSGILMTLVVCPAIGIVVNVISWFSENLIQPYLAINPLTTTNSDGSPNQVYVIWNNIRSVANVALIIVFLMIVFSQATSIGISNYGVKRMLSRLVLSVPFINISFFACAFLIDAFNVLGAGITSLIVSTVLNGAPTVSIGTGLFDIGGVLGQIASLPAQAGMSAGILLGLFAVLVFVSFAFLILAIVVLLRQMLIIGLVLISPLPFVGSLIMPNASNPVFSISKWIDYTIRTLALYPGLMVLMASGTIAAGILSKIGPVNGNQVGSSAASAVMQLFLLGILPALGIPFVLSATNKGLHKFHGGVYGTGKNIQKTATNAAVKKPLGDYKSQLQGKLASNYDPTKSGYKGMNLLSRLATGNLAPGSLSTRRLAAQGETYVNQEVQNAQAVLRRKGITNPQDWARLGVGGKVERQKRDANGNIVRDAQGRAIMETIEDARNNPFMQIAGVRNSIAAGDADSIEMLMTSRTGDKAMIVRELQANYGAVKAAGAHLVKMADPHELVGKSSQQIRDELDEEAVKALSALGESKLAAQDGASAKAAARGVINAPARINFYNQQVNGFTAQLNNAQASGAPQQVIDEINAQIKSAVKDRDALSNATALIKIKADNIVRDPRFRGEVKEATANGIYSIAPSANGVLPNGARVDLTPPPQL